MFLVPATTVCLILMTAGSESQITSLSEIASPGGLHNKGQDSIISYTVSDLNELDRRKRTTNVIDLNELDRRKRTTNVIASAVMLGHRVVKKLLSGATRSKQYTDITVYRKPGGYSQAYADFKSAKLSNIENYGIQKWGFAGDTVVTLEGGVVGAPTTMLIQRFPTDHPNKVFLILYQGRDRQKAIL